MSLGTELVNSIWKKTIVTELKFTPGLLNAPYLSHASSLFYSSQVRPMAVEGIVLQALAFFFSFFLTNVEVASINKGHAVLCYFVRFVQFPGFQFLEVSVNFLPDFLCFSIT